MELKSMAWLRGRGGTRGKEETPPTAPTGPAERPPEVLPDVQMVGTTRDREAYKELRKADARLKRLERQEVRARKREERRLRAIDKRLARIEGSMEMGPVTLLVTLSVLNGAASLFVLLFLWWPDLPLYDPFFLPDTAHWEVVAYCFLVAAISTVYLLVSNPSPRHVERAQRALGVYMAVGIIGTFVGLLMAQVLADMELMDLDWELWMRITLMAATGSAIAMTVIYAVGHRTGSRAFLRTPYHQAMGVVTAVLAVSLVFLPFLYLPYMGWMNEVGVSVYYVSWLLVAFPLPALAASVFVRHRSEELANYYAMA